MVESIWEVYWPFKVYNLGENCICLDCNANYISDYLVLGILIFTLIAKKLDLWTIKNASIKLT